MYKLSVNVTEVVPGLEVDDLPRATAVFELTAEAPHPLDLAEILKACGHLVKEWET